MSSHFKPSSSPWLIPLRTLRTTIATNSSAGSLGYGFSVMLLPLIPLQAVTSQGNRCLTRPARENYSPECVEGVFSELRLYGVLGTSEKGGCRKSGRPRSALVISLLPTIGCLGLAAPLGIRG